MLACDYNAGRFPRAPSLRRSGGLAAVSALGVFEYMCNATNFVAALRAYGAPVLMSYTPLDERAAAGGSFLARFGLASMPRPAAAEALMAAAGLRLARQASVRVPLPLVGGVDATTSVIGVWLPT